MPYVNESNFDTAYPTAARDEFWRRVKFALRHYFNEPESAADKLRTSIESASVGEQLLLYHDDPLQVAADLAGVETPLDETHARDFAKQFPDTLVP